MIGKAKIEGMNELWVKRRTTRNFAITDTSAKVLK